MNLKYPLLLSAALLCSVLVFALYQSEPELPAEGQSLSSKLDLSSQKKHRVKGNLGLDQPDEFALFHKTIRTPEDQTAPSYPPNYRMTELSKARTGAKTRAELPWTERGPGNVAGRARILVVDPEDATASTWFIGSASGGIWKTTDRGQTFVELTSDFPNLATTTLVMAPSNPNVLYAGTGEGFGTFAFIYGQGIWKSTDKGQTWTQLASTIDDRFTNVMRIVVDPNDENIVVAATSSGGRNNSGETARIFRSTDGGNTWTQEYQRSASGIGRVEDLIANPLNFNTLFASSKGRGIIKSTDGGQSWRDVTTGFSGIGRLELAIAPTDTNRVYAAADGGNASYLYMSTDAGESWMRTSEASGNDLNWLGGQGFYDNTIAVNPFNENQVLVGGIDIIQIAVLPGGETNMVPVTDGYGRYGGVPKGVHVDHHHLQFYVTNETTQEYILLNTNDGGISFSTDNGATFTQTGDTFGPNQIHPNLNGLNTTQFYGVDKMNGGARYVGGTQDNGSWISPTDPTSTSEWSIAPSGDGFEAAWHYSEPNRIIESSQFNVIFRSEDGGNSWDFISIPGNGPFLTRIAKSNQDPDLIFAVNSGGVVRSENFGDDWEEIPITSWQLGSEIGNGTVRISNANPEIVWAGTRLTSSSATLHVSTDGGQTFSPTNRYGVVPMGAITDIATHPTDPNTAYALFSFANRPKILKTENLGENWEDISGFGSQTSSSNGFPNVTTYSLLVMPYDTNIIWAGTEIGLFISTDGGTSWEYADNGLPAVAIWQMRIVNNEVVLATHGRGIWSVALPELDGYEPLPVQLKPIIADVRAGLGGELDFDLVLRDTYDSTTVFVDGQRTNVLPASTGRQTVGVQATVPVSSVRDVAIQAISYIEGSALPSTEKNVTLLPAVAPAASYGTNFDGAGLSFYLEGFTISDVAGFSTGALHSPHPYEDLTDVTATLLQPIIVASSGATLSYSDVAIIEPGANGTVFGDEDFYDFVVVEGSNDNGVSWQPIADGYDAREDSGWLSAYNASGNGNESLFVRHEIDLLTTFSPQDTVLIRFRLSSDPLVTGWGWAIDSLGIQTNVLTNIGDERPESFLLRQNYPNPFNPTTTIEYTLSEQAQNVSVDIFDIAGRKVRSLVSIPSQPAGTYSVLWDGTDDAGKEVGSGAYLYRLRAGKHSSTKTMTLIK